MRSHAPGWTTVPPRGAHDRAPAHAVRCACRHAHPRLRGAPRSPLPQGHAPFVPGVVRVHRRRGGERTRHVLPSSRARNERIHPRPGVFHLPPRVPPRHRILHPLKLTRSSLLRQLGDLRVAQSAGMTTLARALAQHVVAPPLPLPRHPRLAPSAGDRQWRRLRRGETALCAPTTPPAGASAFGGRSLSGIIVSVLRRARSIPSASVASVRLRLPWGALVW